MIVGTAGHIDHGKTSLVRALTGIETDRLQEERTRGISIELGYAYVPVEAADGEAPATTLGFVDVPGHERFVHTMVAGAAGIDVALLVIAADDGVMPQTREHLAILQLLVVVRGAVALTKIGRVDAARQARVEIEIAALLAGTPLQDAPVFACNSTVPDDPGIYALRAHLHAWAAADARPAQIYATTFNKDPQFYDFWRAMQSYRTTFIGDPRQKQGETSIILSPDNDYLREFRGRNR